jgi:hypothetical protein
MRKYLIAIALIAVAAGVWLNGQKLQKLVDGQAAPVTAQDPTNAELEQFAQIILGDGPAVPQPAGDDGGIALESTREVLTIGTPNAGRGDTLYDAANKIQNNFYELFNSVYTNAPPSLTYTNMVVSDGTDSATAAEIIDSTDEAPLLRTLSGTSIGDTNLTSFTGDIISDTSTIEGALQELETDLDAVQSLSGVADAAVNLGTFTGDIIADSSTIKSGMQQLETDVDAIQSLSGVADAATNLGTFTGNIVSDGSATVKSAIQELETDLDAVQSLSGVADAATNLGTFTGGIIASSRNIKTALQDLETDTDALQTLSGVVDAATNLGTFTGTTIADSRSIKDAFQDLETYAELVKGESIASKYTASGGYSFDGVDDSLSVDQGWFSNTNFTYAVDFLTSSEDRGTLICFYESAASSTSQTIVRAFGNNILFLDNSNGTTINALSGSAPTNTLISLVITYNGAEVDFWVNGKLNRTVAYGGASDVKDTVSIGVRPTDIDFFTGKIFSTRVWTGVKSDAEIADIFNGYNDTQNLELFLSPDSADRNQWSDVSGNSRNFYAEGAAPINAHSTLANNLFLDSGPFYVLLMGQSNAVGRGTNGGDKDTYNGVKVWNETANKWEVWDLTSNPAQYGVGATVGANNLGFHFAKKLHEFTHREVRVLTVVEGGKQIANWTTPGSLKYANLEEQTAAANIKRFDVCLWHQGESDNGSATYEADFDTVLSNLRAEDWFDENTVFIAGQLASEPASATYPHGNRNDDFFDPFLFGKKYNSQNVYLALCENYPLTDQVHFDGKSLVRIGREAYWKQWMKHHFGFEDCIQEQFQNEVELTGTEYIELPNLGLTFNEATVFVTFTPGAGTSAETIFGFDQGSTTPTSKFAVAYNDRQINSQILSPSGALNDFPSIGINENRQYTLALSFRDGSQKWWVNGVFVHENDGAIGDISPTSYEIGSQRDGTARMTGKFHEFYFWPTCLSDDEVERFFRHRKINREPTVRLENSSITTEGWICTSGNSNHATFSGSPTVVNTEQPITKIGNIWLRDNSGTPEYSADGGSTWSSL